MSTAQSSSLPVRFSEDFSATGFPLLQKTVHLWWFSWSESSSGFDRKVRAAYWDWLSVDEVERAERFHFSHHAEEWVANRARLRMLLGSYLQRDGREIEFVYDAGGKPRVADSNPDVNFNLSHADGAAVVALARGVRVGIDVERSDRGCESMDLARFSFSSSEVAALGRISDNSVQATTFLKLWTCKEALLKGMGDGLSRLLADFSISLDRRNPTFEECLWDASLTDRWQLYSLEAPSGYVSSLAVEAPERFAVKTFSWTPESTVL